MEPKPTVRLKCESIPYRQGFIEVTPSIHAGHVNIETWDIQSKTSLDNVSWVDSDSISDEDVVANTELELTAFEAEKLADAIMAAVRQLNREPG